MLVSFRAHLASGILNFISLIFTAIALFTCGWLNYSYSILGSSSNFGLGLLVPSQTTTCLNLSRTSSVNATIAFMMIAFICQILEALHILATSVYRRFNDHVLKVDSVLLTLSFMCLFIAILIFGFSSNGFYSYSSWLGYSYVLACISTFIALLAMGPVGHALREIRECGDCECSATYW